MSTKRQVDLREQFGRYRILKLLGQGGMGAVYLARDESLHREVALKVPHIDFDETPQALERFYQEAKAAATFRHPNICPIYEVGEVDGLPYLAMAYIDGQPLTEWARTDKPLSQRKIADLVRKVALALAEAHGKGVIHRDIKSSNIMINSRGEPIIMDFGLARRDKPGDARITQCGTIMGSPAYMAPEQVRDLMSAGPACDIYSLGVVLYELLARRLPFLGPPMEVISQLLLDPPPPPSRFRPDIDPALEAICLKALAKTPQERQPTMARLASELTAYLRGEPASQRATVPRPVKAAPPQPAMQVEDMGGARSMMMAYHEGLAQKSARPRQARKDSPTLTEPSRPGRRSAGFPWLAVGIGSAVGLIVAVVGILVWIGNKKFAPTTSSVAKLENPPTAEPPPIVEKKPTRKETDTKPSLPPPPPRNGFRPLFNGSDFTGWVEQPKRGVWQAGNNELSYKVTNRIKEHGWLLTDRDYGDFILRLEFKLAAGAHSAVGLRMGPQPASDYLAVQIRDDRAPRYAKTADTTKTGALYNLAINRPARLRPLEDWNTMEIELRGVWLRVKVNGAETCVLPLDSERVRKHLGAPAGAVGRIGLQNFAGSVRFRKIELKEGGPGSLSGGVSSPSSSGRWAIDLQAKANQKLDENMGVAGNILPIRVGKHESPIEGIPFLVGPSLIRVGNNADNSKPLKVVGIKVGAAFRVLHLIHAATGGRPRTGTLVGSYVVHYADGTETTIPILYGIDVMHWWAGPMADVQLEGKVAWNGKNAATAARKKVDTRIRIYQSKWSNPRPDVKVETIDFVSAETAVSPFVLAMTRES